MTPQRRMGTAVALSLAAHVLLLSAAAANRPAQPERVDAGQLTVTLQRESGTVRQLTVTPEKTNPEPVKAQSAPEPPQPQPAPRETQTPARVAAKPAPTQPVRDPVRNETAKPAQSPGAEAPAQMDAPQTSPGASQAILARLEHELARHFQYPLLARRRGWEGEVVLDLRIDGQGKIDSMEIARTSGHGILDRAALDAVTRISRIPDAAELLGGAGMHVQLPVIYRLKEG